MGRVVPIAQIGEDRSNLLLVASEQGDVTLQGRRATARNAGQVTHSDCGWKRLQDLCTDGGTWHVARFFEDFHRHVFNPVLLRLAALAIREDCQ